MADLGGLPPWLNVGPRDYLSALHSGLSTGLQIGEAQNRADQLANQQAIRQAESERDAKLRAWEFTQAMAQRAAQTKAANEAKLEQARAMKSYRDAMLDFRHQMEQRRLATELAKENKPSLHNVGGHLLSVQGGKVTDLFTDPNRIDPAEKGLLAEQAKAQAAVDVAKRKAGRYTATQPKVETVSNWHLLNPSTWGVPNTTVTNQVPLVDDEAGRTTALADLESAVNVLGEKQSALKAYRKGGKSSGGSKLVWNAKTGNVEPAEQTDEEGE